MAISSVGKRSKRGVTLIEMMTVVAIIAVVAGISFPAVSAGIDSLRLSSATDSIASFLNAAQNRAERRQCVVQVSISAKERSLSMRSTEPGFFRKIELPDGIAIEDVLPQLAEETDAPRRFLFLPGGTAPRLGVRIANRRGARRFVSVDPMTGVPQVVVPEAQ